METPNKIPFYIQATIILAGTIALFTMLYYGQSIFVPLLFALFIAILTNPIVNFLTRRKVHRLIAISISVFLVVALIAGVIAFVSLQVSMFSETFPQFKAKFNSTMQQGIIWTSHAFHLDKRAVEKWLSDAQVNAVHYLTGNAGQALLSAGSSLIGIVIIPVYIFLILYYNHCCLLLLENYLA